MLTTVIDKLLKGLMMISAKSIAKQITISVYVAF